MLPPQTLPSLAEMDAPAQLDDRLQITNLNALIKDLTGISPEYPTPAMPEKVELHQQMDEQMNHYFSQQLDQMQSLLRLQEQQLMQQQHLLNGGNTLGYNPNIVTGNNAGGSLSINPSNFAGGGRGGVTTINQQSGGGVPVFLPLIGTSVENPLPSVLLSSSAPLSGPQINTTTTTNTFADGSLSSGGGGGGGGAGNGLQSHGLMHGANGTTPTASPAQIQGAMGPTPNTSAANVLSTMQLYAQQQQQSQQQLQQMLQQQQQLQRDGFNNMNGMLLHDAGAAIVPMMTETTFAIDASLPPEANVPARRGPGAGGAAVGSAAAAGAGTSAGVVPIAVPRAPRPRPSGDRLPRTSRYRGVTKHRRSGRYEAHIWVKDLGRQVYLGGYENEGHAAEAYDIAALKSKGSKTRINFELSKYSDLLGCLHNMTMEELVMAVRRQSQGFSRGTSTYRGVTHHPSGRWEARIGIPGSKHVYLGLFVEEKLAAQAYDQALVRLRGGTAATNFSLSEYRLEMGDYHRMQSRLLLNDPLFLDISKNAVLYEKWIKSGTEGFPEVMESPETEKKLDDIAAILTINDGVGGGDGNARDVNMNAVEDAGGGGAADGVVKARRGRPRGTTKTAMRARNHVDSNGESKDEEAVAVAAEPDQQQQLESVGPAMIALQQQLAGQMQQSIQQQQQQQQQQQYTE
jgi:hypothetical protein